MSYDIDFELDGGAGPIRVGRDFNYTSNCAPMWRMAMPLTDGLAGLEGTSCKSAAVTLAAGIARMEADPAAYRKLNPANGWGDYDSTLELLRDLLAQCKSIPNATVRIYR